MAEKYFTIYVKGDKAASIGLKYQNGKCYRRIADELGFFLGQLEVVLDDLVCVSYIKTMDDVQKVLRELARNGFAGMEYELHEQKEEGCFAETKYL